jgi:hypothetical protein
MLLLLNAHSALTVAVCAFALAFALDAWRLRHGSSMAVPVSLLWLDLFAWNFAELARSVTGSEVWHHVDRLFSTMMPPIATHLVLQIIGRQRSMRRWLAINYVGFATLAVAQPRNTWWLLLFVSSCLVIGVALVLLWRYRKKNVDPQERDRIDLIFVATVVATLLGATDLWRNETPYSPPPLANVGMLAAMGLVWYATHRSRLLGKEIPSGLVVPSALAGVVLFMAYLAGVRWLDERSGGSGHDRSRRGGSILNTSPCSAGFRNSSRMIFVTPWRL